MSSITPNVMAVHGTPCLVLYCEKASRKVLALEIEEECHLHAWNALQMSGMQGDFGADTRGMSPMC